MSESVKRRGDALDENEQKELQRQRNSDRKRAEEDSRRELEQRREKNRYNAVRAINKKARANTSFLEKYSYFLAIGGFIALVGLALASFIFGDHRKLHEIPVLDEGLISSYQSGLPFTLGQNSFFEGWTLLDAKGIINNGLATRGGMRKCPGDDSASPVLEPAYSAKEARPECFQKSFPINQGNCSSSWAIAPADVFADRYCMLSGTPFKASAQQILSCDVKSNAGCKSGYIMSALDFGKTQGYVDSRCVPYEAKGPEEAACNPEATRSCARQFIEEHCVVEGEEEIKKEIYRNGPVVGIIPVFRDFLAYKNGIYEAQEGVSRFDSGQAVKVFGWGNENGRNYWLVENYWGDTWGENGVVKIFGGQEDMYLDSFAISIRPKYTQPIGEPYQPPLQDDDIPTDRQYI